MKMNSKNILLFLALLFFSYSFAQESQELEELPHHPKILSPDEIPKGFAAQAQTEEQEQAPEEQQEQPLAIQSGKMETHEAFLDSVERMARQLLPARNTLDEMAFRINEETAPAKLFYESEAAYAKKVASFEKNKKTRIAKLEKQYRDKEKNIRSQLSDLVKGKDFQPDWGNILEKNAENVDEYQERIEILKKKMADASIDTNRISKLFTQLKIDQSDINALEKKNLLYMKRLERACDVMLDYMLQDYSQVLTTEVEAGGFVVGAYDPEKSTLPINVRNTDDKATFDWHGVLKKVPSAWVQDMTSSTEGFEASVRYINYPFVTNGIKTYPGAKDIEITYFDQRLKSDGAFKSLESYNAISGYSEWAIRADSILTGKLKYRNLDDSYARKKVKVGPPFWTPKRIVFASSLVLAAASAGVGFWQDQLMRDKTVSANNLYADTYFAAINGEKALYEQKAIAYEDKVDSRKTSQMLRNGFYISAGSFGLIALMSLTF